MAKRGQSESQQYRVVLASGLREPRQHSMAARGYSNAAPNVFVEWPVIAGNQNFETSLYRAKTMMLRTTTIPI